MPRKIREVPDENPTVIEAWPSDFDAADMAVLKTGNVVWRDGDVAYYQEEEDE